MLMAFFKNLENKTNSLKDHINVDIDFLEYIEDYLIKSGVYIECVSQIMNYLVKKTINQKVTRYGMVSLLKEKIIAMVNRYAKVIEIDDINKPHVMLVCGINGSGKTTLIGKMSYLLTKMNWKVTVAACDTFRSAAEEQLRICTNFENVDVIAKDYEKQTPYSVLVKAYKASKDNKSDVLVVDTSGRVHNNKNLMQELKKIRAFLATI